MAAGPIGIAQVDNATNAGRRHSPNTDGFQSRLTAEMLRNTQHLAEATQNIRNSQDQMNVLARKRAELQEGYNKAVARGNTELQEHYKKQLENLREQRGYVYDTLRSEERRRKVEADLLALSQRQGQLSEADTRRQQRLATAQALLNQRLLVRNTIQRTAVQQNVSMARAEQQITQSLQQQANFREQMAQQLAQAQEQQRLPDGTTIRQRAVAGAVGVASGFTLANAWGKLTSSISGLVEMSDLATEAQYTFGTSLDRNKKSVKEYTDRSIDLSKVNADLIMSFAQMGLSAEDSEKAIPTMMATSGTALRAYQDQNYDVLKAMTKSIGAFARQNNVSFEDAAKMQGMFIDKNNMNVAQAEEQMESISASTRAMNNQLMDAGFKGQLLNVGEFWNLTQQAAESTESLAFNTKVYNENLGKAARNARLLGSSQKNQ